MSIHLGCLTISAAGDELSEEGRHSWPPVVLLHLVESVEEPFMSPGRGLMEGLYYVMAGQFWDIESIFEIEVPMLKYPVFLVGPRKPGFSSFIVHGSKAFADNRV